MLAAESESSAADRADLTEQMLEHFDAGKLPLDAIADSDFPVTVTDDRASVDAVGPTIDIDEARDGEFHGDFVTPEYTFFDEIRDEKWECCRGIGHSFGYNRAEDDDHLIPEELVHSFVDIVSKNGNLLINVGPRADGTIPEPQRETLLGLGAWLDTNSEAVFGSRPWAVAEDDASDVDVRYTHVDGDLYAIALDWPGDRLEISVPWHVDIDGVPDAALLSPDGDVAVDVTRSGDELVVALPERPDTDHAYAVRLSAIGNPRED